MNSAELQKYKYHSVIFSYHIQLYALVREGMS